MYLEVKDTALSACQIIIITHASMKKQDFPVLAGWGGASLELFCKGLQLMIAFIMDQSANEGSFLN